MDNITYRRQRRKALSLSDSELNLSNKTSNSSVTNLTLSNSPYNKSLPQISTLDTSSVCDLKQQLENVQYELSSAHEEIITLNSEIAELKKIINEQNKKIDFLKKVKTTSTPILKNTILSNKLSLSVQKQSEIRSVFFFFLAFFNL